MDKRIGRFHISEELINNSPLSIMELMGKCIIVRAENMYHMGAIEYHAICDYFDPVPQGNIIPEYQWVHDGKEWSIYTEQDKE